MRSYKFEVTITEGSDEFWESLGDQTGCDDVLSEIKCLFDEAGWEPEIKLVEYTNK